MGTVTERLALLIDADGKGAIREFQRIGQTAERDLTKAEARIDGLSNKLVGFGAGAFTGGAVALGGLYQLASGAADVGEAANKASVIFGDSFSEIEKYAEGAAASIGQSKRQALDAASTFGQFGKAAGLSGGELSKFSTSLTGLASDMASFNNASPDEVVDALGAALRGENEPIRRFGVLLDDATLKQEALKQGLISTTTQALTPQQKALAAYGQIMKQTADQQGDFARTADSLPNKIRSMQAAFEDTKNEVGEAVIPTFDKLLSITNDALGVFNKLPDSVKAGLGTVASLGAVGSVAAGGLSTVAGGALKAKSALDTFADGGDSKIRNLAGSLSGNLAPALLGVGTVIAGGIAIWDAWSSAAQAAEKRAEAFADNFIRSGTDAAGAVGEELERIFDQGDETDGFRDAFQKARLSVAELSKAIVVAGADFDAARDAGDGFSQALSNLAEAPVGSPELASSVAGLRDWLKEADAAARPFLETLVDQYEAGQLSRSEFQKAVDTLAELSQSYNVTGEQVSYYADQLDQAIPKAQRTAEANKLIADAMNNNTPIEDRRAALQQLADLYPQYATAISGVIDPEKRAADATNAVKDALKGAEPALDTAKDKVAKLTEKWDEYTSKLKGSFDPLFAVVDAQGRLTDAQTKAGEVRTEKGAGSPEFAEASTDIAKAALDLDIAKRELGKAVETGALDMGQAIAQLNGYRDAGILTEEQLRIVAGEIEHVGQVGADVAAQEVVVRARADTAAAEAKLLALKKLRDIAGGTTIVDWFTPGALPGRAGGGPVTGGQAYIVGERRPEVFVPGTSGTIIPYVPTQTAAQTTTNNTWNITTTADARETAAAAIAAQRRDSILRGG